MSSNLIQPPLLAALILALGFAGSLLPGPIWDFPEKVGWSVLGFGLVIVLWARLRFMRYRTTLFVGHRPVTLVQSGPFRFSRNPMYLGMTIASIGIALLHGHWVWFLAPPVFVIFISCCYLPREEDMLRATFGESYDRYAARVRRWI